MAEIKAFVTSLPAAPSSVGPSTLPLGAARRWASTQGCQEFADDPKAFRATFDTENAEIAKLIVDAQKLLPDVVMPDELKVKISEVCSELNVDGLRGDIVSNRAARAYAAYEGRTEVTEADVRKVLTPCLRHRLRKDVLDTMDSGDRVEKVCAKVFDDE
eukprot:TRINITY_DN7624_c0_g1_i2.p1 TRINITY_DN7624_c0_g1~~TRINITY_DN7624_c0_g1_i2.p1  ORF type:complete len:159 (-),score=45.21 TRINITY_DN7624_c0_g1_i2:163-639(-)